MLGSEAIDQARGVVIAIGAALGVDQSLTVIAQALPAVSDAYLMQLAEKGGGWVVLLIVLFFYRRDYQKLTMSDNETRKELLAAIAKQADSETKLAVALSENTEVMRQIAREVRDR
jgi:hypothetical protein